MANVGMERRLHMPAGSAYTKMFPDSPTDGTDILTYSDTGYL